jgi:general secretion pathway protein L
MLRDFFSWWIGQLADLFPAHWVRFGSMREDLVIDPLGQATGEVDEIGVTFRHRGGETPLGRFSLTAASMAALPHRPGQRWTLRLRQGDVLAKTVTLPIAAEGQLYHALAFQMHQQTPFRPDEIYWSHFLEKRDRPSGRISVRLLLVPRRSLAVLLRALDQVGIAPNRAEIGDGPDRGRILRLEGNGGSLDGTEHRAGLWAAVACCLILAVGAIATPFVRQVISLASFDQNIAARRTIAAEAERLRGELDRLSGTLKLVERERDKVGRPLAILATLTGILPDDTYLTEATVRRRKVTLSGSSAAAARLIGTLSTTEGVLNAAFAAPVTRLETNNAELFTITAEVAQ